MAVSALLPFLPLSMPFTVFFFFNDTATTEIYTLSLHDALPISLSGTLDVITAARKAGYAPVVSARSGETRSEEHTSELQSQSNLVCRLLLEKKKKKKEEQRNPKNKEDPP